MEDLIESKKVVFKTFSTSKENVLLAQKNQVMFIWLYLQKLDSTIIKKKGITKFDHEIEQFCNNFAKYKEDKKQLGSLISKNDLDFYRPYGPSGMARFKKKDICPKYRNQYNKTIQKKDILHCVSVENSSDVMFEIANKLKNSKLNPQIIKSVFDKTHYGVTLDMVGAFLFACDQTASLMNNDEVIGMNKFHKIAAKIFQNAINDYNYNKQRLKDKLITDKEFIQEYGTFPERDDELLALLNKPQEVLKSMINEAKGGEVEKNKDPTSSTMLLLSAQKKQPKKVSHDESSCSDKENAGINLRNEKEDSDGSYSFSLPVPSEEDFSSPENESDGKLSFSKNLLMDNQSSVTKKSASKVLEVDDGTLVHIPRKNKRLESTLKDVKKTSSIPKETEAESTNHQGDSNNSSFKSNSSERKENSEQDETVQPVNGKSSSNLSSQDEEREKKTQFVQNVTANSIHKNFYHVYIKIVTHTSLQNCSTNFKNLNTTRRVNNFLIVMDTKTLTVVARMIWNPLYYTDVRIKLSQIFGDYGHPMVISYPENGRSLNTHRYTEKINNVKNVFRQFLYDDKGTYNEEADEALWKMDIHKRMFGGIDWINPLKHDIMVNLEHNAKYENIMSEKCRLLFRTLDVLMQNLDMREHRGQMEESLIAQAQLVVNAAPKAYLGNGTYVEIPRITQSTPFEKMYNRPFFCYAQKSGEIAITNMYENQMDTSPEISNQLEVLLGESPITNTDPPLPEELYSERSEQHFNYPPSRKKGFQTLGRDYEDKVVRGPAPPFHPMQWPVGLSNTNNSSSLNASFRLLLDMIDVNEFLNVDVQKSLMEQNDYSKYPVLSTYLLSGEKVHMKHENGKSVSFEEHSVSIELLEKALLKKQDSVAAVEDINLWTRDGKTSCCANLFKNILEHLSTEIKELMQQEGHRAFAQFMKNVSYTVRQCWSHSKISASKESDITDGNFVNALSTNKPLEKEFMLRSANIMDQHLLDVMLADSCGYSMYERQEHCDYVKKNCKPLGGSVSYCPINVKKHTKYTSKYLIFEFKRSFATATQHRRKLTCPNTLEATSQGYTSEPIQVNYSFVSAVVGKRISQDKCQFDVVKLHNGLYYQINGSSKETEIIDEDTFNELISYNCVLVLYRKEGGIEITDQFHEFPFSVENSQEVTTVIEEHLFGKRKLSSSGEERKSPSKRKKTFSFSDIFEEGIVTEMNLSSPSNDMECKRTIEEDYHSEDDCNDKYILYSDGLHHVTQNTTTYKCLYCHKLTNENIGDGYTFVCQDCGINKSEGRCDFMKLKKSYGLVKMRDINGSNCLVCGRFACQSPMPCHKFGLQNVCFLCVKDGNCPCIMCTDRDSYSFGNEALMLLINNELVVKRVKELDSHEDRLTLMSGSLEHRQKQNIFLKASESNLLVALNRHKCRIITQFRGHGLQTSVLKDFCFNDRKDIDPVLMKYIKRLIKASLKNEALISPESNISISSEDDYASVFQDLLKCDKKNKKTLMLTNTQGSWSSICFDSTPKEITIRFCGEESSGQEDIEKRLHDISVEMKNNTNKTYVIVGGEQEHFGELTEKQTRSFKGTSGIYALYFLLHEMIGLDLKINDENIRYMRQFLCVKILTGDFLYF